MERATRYVQAALVACVVLLLVAAVEAAPKRALWPASVPYSPTDNGCNGKPNVERLCQLCAASTKSPMVYPMCCNDMEDVQVWCIRYLSFGIQ
ncbi:uncharacterized protein LOC124595220 [Schistocerca americana]|uniref:uncharacterized protein LOC124595220 n=1 Tax=Schistocerca americana TaxID=7009 RepID=UPI001F4FD8B2|nr:uncharacterized protein LOC124595220 [Schistocerca americana]XP_047107804.1 uncharacterized protein LOC124776729 [Schistocerca piceifrons]XP_049775296.1 uncharacterized protein LOC126162685 [Schistocerca cancellata]XP_049853565.1 uncharacterized protein LOC126334899 [Schistocerca gregaria]XP_049950870.1 uncharacterized protein LOC126458092 [Schistocerca serialis cubense]